MPPHKKWKTGPTRADQFLTPSELNEIKVTSRTDDVDDMTSRGRSPRAHLQEKSEILHTLLHGKLQQVAAEADVIATSHNSDVITYYSQVSSCINA